MRFIGNIIEKLQRHPKRVVFPEGTEPRILQAARQFYALRLGAPIVLGNQAKVIEIAEGLNTSIEGIRIIDPSKVKIWIISPGVSFRFAATRAFAPPKRARRCCNRIISAR